MEIFQGVERRRRWSLAEKLRIVAEAEAPGAIFAHVARRYDLSRGQLWSWRHQVRSGELGKCGAARSDFLAVCVVQDTPPALPKPSPAVACHDAAHTVQVAQTAEIVFPDGTCLRIDAESSPAALRRLLEVLRG